MEDFKKIISFDVVKKQRAMERILIMIVNFPEMPQYEELYRKINEGESKGLISEEEFLATYNLGKKLLELVVAGKIHNAKILKYLFKADSSISHRNLLKFINFATRDIEETRANNPNQEWQLSINKILKRIEQEGETKIVDSLTKE